MNKESKKNKNQAKLKGPWSDSGAEYLKSWLFYQILEAWLLQTYVVPQNTTF